MLQPNSSWYWTIDDNYLAIVLSDSLLMRTAIKASRMNTQIDMREAFTLEHTECYFDMLNCIADSDSLSEAKAVHIALNAVAAKFFARVVGHKSWYFCEQSPDNQLLKSHSPSLCQLQSSVNQTARYLLLSRSENSAIVMLIEPEHQWDEHKMVKEFSLVRVFADRIYSIANDITLTLQKSA